MRLLAFALVLASAAQGQLRAPRIRSSGGLSKRFPNAAPASNVVLQFAPSSGSGLRSVADLCDTYSSDMTGNYFCIRGDGTQLSGGITMTAGGSPTVTSQALCPNGTDCTATSGVRLNGTNQNYAGAARASPTGDVTACWLGYLDDTTGSYALIDKEEITANQNAFRIETNGAAALSGYVYKTDGSSTAISSSTNYIAGAEHFICMVYDFIADGSSLLTFYQDGVANTGGGVSSIAVGPIQAASSTPWEVGSRTVAASRSWAKGRIRNAFMTEQALSAAKIAAMARTGLADVPTGSAGEALTFTRASTKFCPNSAGTAGSWLPVNRPCITGGGINIEGAATNIQIRSSEFDNAAWSKVGVTVTANTTDVTAPDGTYTAEKLDYLAATGGTDQRILYKGNPATVAAYSQSLYLRSSAATATIYLFYYDGTTFKKTTCALTNTAWSRCLNENQTLSLSTWNFTLGTDRNDATQASQPAQTVYAWQGQHELGTFATSTIVTAGTSVSRSADDASVATPTGLTDAVGCVGATFLVSAYSSAAPQRIIALDSAASVTPLYLSAANSTGSYDGTNFGTSPLGSLTGVSTRAATGWAGATTTIYRAGSTTTVAYDGAWGLTASVTLGNGSLNRYLYGTISDVKLGRTTGACQ